MKRLISFLSVLAGAFVLSGTAAAQSGVYLQVDGGAAFLGGNESAGIDIEYDPGYTIGGRLGVHVTPGLRIEGDVTYLAAEIDELDGISLSSLGADADVSAITFGIGIYADILQAGIISPYLGAGVGGAYKELDTNFGADDEETDLQAHVEFGIGFDLTPNVVVVPHYRFLWVADTFDDEQFAHLLRLGLRLQP